MAASVCLRAGVDDCGSGPFTGFACVVLRAEGAAELEKKGHDLLKQAGLSKFHGREFNSGCDRERAAYEAFVMVTREALERHGELVALQLNHQTTYREVFVGFAGRVVEGVLAQLRHQAPDFAVTKAGSLFALARSLSDITHLGDASVDVEMDKSQVGDAEAGAALVGLASSAGALLTSVMDSLVKVTNAYKSQQFPEGPRIGSLRVCHSQDSILVQAADVLANFGVAWLKSQLRRGSRSGEREYVRARIFEKLAGTGTVELSSTLHVSNNELNGGADDNARLVLTAFPVA